MKQCGLSGKVLGLSGKVIGKVGMRKDGNIKETGSSQSMEELVCLAKEL